MNEPEPLSGEASTTEQQRQLDRVCDQFEAQWKSSSPPRLEDYVTKTPSVDQSALFGELLVVELSYRADRGERPVREDYFGRFPEHASAIAAAFDEWHPPSSPEGAGSIGSTVSFRRPPSPDTATTLPSGREDQPSQNLPHRTLGDYELL